MPLLKDILAANIKRILSEKKITQRELADQIGVSFQTISAIVNARSGLTGDTLAKISSALGVEETDLVAVQKPVEKVELNKNHWKVLDEYFEQHSPSKKPKSEAMKDLHGVPQDILDGLTSIDPRLQETAWKTIRAVIATFGKPGKSSSEAG